jgi:hypothetical protein
MVHGLGQSFVPIEGVNQKKSAVLVKSVRDPNSDFNIRMHLTGRSAKNKMNVFKTQRNSVACGRMLEYRDPPEQSLGQEMKEELEMDFEDLLAD